MSRETVQDEIRGAFADAGVAGWLHARPVAAPSRRVPFAELAVGADDVVPSASVYKLPLLVAFCRAVDAGEIDPVARTTLAVDGRSGGSGGVSIMSDPVTLSWRDAVTSMIAVSDNAAADAVHRRLGTARVRSALDALGLARTQVQGNSTDELDRLIAATGAGSGPEAFRALADNDRPIRTGYAGLVGSVTTARESTDLLSALWTGRAASATQCAFARRVLCSRVGSHRLRLGFPVDDVVIAEKTGTFGALRHAVGVVEFPGEQPWAVAVFTQAARSDRVLLAAEEVIGTAARLAVQGLRRATRGAGSRRGLPVR